MPCTMQRIMQSAIRCLPVRRQLLLAFQRRRRASRRSGALRVQRRRTRLPQQREVETASLQPYVPQAATVFTTRCNRKYRLPERRYIELARSQGCNRGK